MKDFSQNGEQQIILDYFKNHKGGYLDLGANDGKTLSNTKALHDLGWNGVCVEPSNEAFEKIKSSQPNAIGLNFAVSDTDGEIEFYESGTHLKNGDTSLLSTLKKSELNRWEGSDNHFNKTKCNSVSVPTLLSKLKLFFIGTYDFISIDIEGLDYDVLVQMNLKSLGCKMLCIETNSIEDQKYIDYCANFGMKVIHKNGENLIFTV